MISISAINKIKEDFSKDSLGRTLERLSHLLKGTEREIQVTQIYSRFSNLNDRVMDGTIGQEDFSLTFNQISKSTLMLLDKIKEERGKELKLSANNRVEELVKILMFRAKSINSKLKKHRKISLINDYLIKFNSLHEQHIKELRNNNVILAHEILGEIYTLSKDLEIDASGEKEEVQKLLSRGLAYLIDPLQKYKNGPMIKWYIGKDSSYSRSLRYKADEFEYYEYYLSIF